MFEKIAVYLKKMFGCDGCMINRCDMGSDQGFSLIDFYERDCSK